jgi:hypothetical protein
VRVQPPEGVVIDPKKRPFVVVDPRAGHGPGIGAVSGERATRLAQIEKLFQAGEAAAPGAGQAG